ncbi:5'-nucleotidase C-terminal domain-containing protein [Nonlabens sp.]|uniref:5'-nucleotidase C-terminal domain-containing protein n=1 Tax=Nonlabens sp. TaxID=1888209 RepID=UPI003F69DDD3
MKTSIYKRAGKAFFYLAFAKALFITTSCKPDHLHLVKVEASQTSIDSTLQSVTAIEDYIAPYKKSLDAQMDEQLSYNPVSMHKNDFELNTPIGNMMAEIVMKQGNPIFLKRSGEQIDVVLINHGGIRAPLHKGAVTMRSAYEIMPFENSIVVAQLNAVQMTSLINYLVKRKRAHPISGLTIKLDKNGKLLEALINGKPLSDNEHYYVATNDYLYNGGDNMSFFKDTPITQLDYKIRNAMIDYFKETDTLKFKRDDRFTMVH